MLCVDNNSLMRIIYRLISECEVGGNKTCCVQKRDMDVLDLLMVLTLTTGPNLNDRDRAIIVKKRKKPTQFMWTIAKNVQ